MDNLIFTIIGLVFLITKKKQKEENEKFTKKDFPYILGMIVLDIVAPILLMFGLLDSASSNASLLNNFEIVCTSLIALFIFKEVVSKRMWIAISLITLSSFVLSFEDISEVDTCSFKDNLAISSCFLFIVLFMIFWLEVISYAE